MTAPYRYPAPPPMPTIRKAEPDIAELQKAVERAKAAWSPSQLTDALTSIKYWTQRVEAHLTP